MKIVEVLEGLDAIDSGSLTTAAWRGRLTKKRQGRTPAFAYEHLQQRINEVAPKINPKHWKAHSFANRVYESFLLEGNSSVQKAAQISNLIQKGVLILPPAPTEEKVETCFSRAVGNCYRPLSFISNLKKGYKNEKQS